MNYIPENINLVYSVEKEVGDTEVIPAFPCDTENKKTNETAQNWAKGKRRCYIYDEKLGRRTLVDDPKEIQTFTQKNDPMEGVRILNLEIRSQGGRAWKGMIPGGFYVDIREDTMLEAITTDGIDPGGVLRGQYIFAMFRSQMKVIKVGSDIHQEIVGVKDRRKMKKISARDLIPGRKYYTKSNAEYYFIGFVTTAELQAEMLQVYSSYSWKKSPKVIGKRSKYQLWYKRYPCDKDVPAAKVKKQLAEIEEYKIEANKWIHPSYRFCCVKSKDVVDSEEIPKEEQTTIQEVKDMCLAGVQVQIDYKPNKAYSPFPVEADSRTCLMVPYGEKWECPELYKKYL